MGKHKRSNDYNETMRLLSLQGGVCFWCLRAPYPLESMQQDHVNPERDGGKYTVAACLGCNQHKGTKPFHQFYIHRVIKLAELIQDGHGRRAWGYMCEHDDKIVHLLIAQGEIPISKDFLIKHVSPFERASISAELLYKDESFLSYMRCVYRMAIFSYRTLYTDENELDSRYRYIMQGHLSDEELFLKRSELAKHLSEFDGSIEDRLSLKRCTSTQTYPSLMSLALMKLIYGNLDHLVRDNEIYEELSGNIVNDFFGIME